MTIGGWDKVLQVVDEDLNLVPEGPQYPSVLQAAAPIQLLIDLTSDLGANHFMTTHGALRTDGHIDAETRTETKTLFGGFTGGVQCFFADANGITIGTTQVHSFGVDGGFGKSRPDGLLVGGR